MTLFFLVVGLEAKRQLDLGELRERRRLAIPIFAAIGGIAVLVALGLIATVYAGNVSLVAVSAATALFVALVGLRYAPFGRRAISIGLAAGIWIALFSSGSDPAISGLASGWRPAHTRHPARTSSGQRS
jgi:Na+/H+ antiporter NhaA